MAKWLGLHSHWSWIAPLRSTTLCLQIALPQGSAQRCVLGCARASDAPPTPPQPFQVETVTLAGQTEGYVSGCV